MMLDLVGLVPPWVAQAACGSAEVDPEIFFPDAGQNSQEQTDTVRRLCRHCPVVVACAEYAIVNEIEHGIWGGLTDISRRRVGGRQGRGAKITSPRPCGRCGNPVIGRGSYCGESCKTLAHREQTAS